MLLQMVLQKDKEFVFYIEIPHPLQDKLYPHQLPFLKEINQLLLAVSQALNIATDSVDCAQTISLLEASRLKPKPTTDVIS